MSFKLLTLCLRKLLQGMQLFIYKHTHMYIRGGGDGVEGDGDRISNWSYSDLSINKIYIFVKSINVSRIINRAAVRNSPLIQTMVVSDSFFPIRERWQTHCHLFTKGAGKPSPRFAGTDIYVWHRCFSWMGPAARKRKRLWGPNKIGVFKCLIFSPCGFCHQIL